MRVISGKYRGMVLAEFKGMEIRPTADRVKESLFNILSFKYGIPIIGPLIQHSYLNPFVSISNKTIVYPG